MKKVILSAVFLPALAYGQITTPSGSVVLVNRVRAGMGDIVITEIMADPLPVVSLPPEEYIEIFNRTEYYFNLENWKLSSDDRSAIFPPVEIKPGEYLILCSSSDTSLFSQFGKTIGLKSFPVLTNDGRVIVISDTLGNLICGVEYSSAWYWNSLKEGGGWSLEIIDSDYPFFSEGNWTASTSRNGGTPGSVNLSSGNNPDPGFSGVTDLLLTDTAAISLVFDEPVFNLIANLSKITISQNTIVDVLPADPLYRKFNLITGKSMVRGVVYTLYLPDNITDFAGNPSTGSELRFGIPDPVEKRDIVFNELLFNPLPDDPDYIELYNLSGKVIDASELFLASVDEESGETSATSQLTSEQRCILPGSFYVVTTDREKVKARYPASVAGNIFKSISLPSMPDDRGHLLLVSRQLDLIDEVLYNEKMHYPLLSGNEGIGLEKIRPDLPSDESMSWHSASESSGWGTPGAENSVFSVDVSVADQIVFSSPKISPDNDGFEDMLVIDIYGEGLGNAVTVTVFDETGSIIRKVAENYYAGNKASLIWDGTCDDGSLVYSGIYIVLVEMYDDKGKTERWKKVVAVVGR